MLDGAPSPACLRSSYRPTATRRLSRRSSRALDDCVALSAEPPAAVPPTTDRHLASEEDHLRLREAVELRLVLEESPESCLERREGTARSILLRDNACPLFTPCGFSSSSRERCSRMTPPISRSVVEREIVPNPSLTPCSRRQREIMRMLEIESPPRCDHGASIETSSC